MSDFLLLTEEVVEVATNNVANVDFSESGRFSIGYVYKDPQTKTAAVFTMLISGQYRSHFCNHSNHIVTRIG